MAYLITQISLFMIAAALTGVIIGGLLGYVLAIRQNKTHPHNQPLFLEQDSVKIHKDTELPDIEGNSQPIECIETIQPRLLEQLKNEPFMITTTLHLLDVCRTQTQCQTLARQLSTELSVINQWRCVADLMRLPEMNYLSACLLEETTIQSVQDLAERETVSLAAQLTETQIRHHPKNNLPNAKTVSEWIHSAQKLQSLFRLS